MNCFLLIETSHSSCSIAISANKQLVFERTQIKNKSHSSLLGGFVKEAIEYTNKKKLLIKAISASSGPGSYTGLRIGVSIAKGLCYGLSIPFITIPTLQIMTCQAIHEYKISINPVIYCPMIDIRNMDVFSALYSKTLNELRIPQIDTITKNSYKLYLKQYSIVFFGNGSYKCRNIIKSPKAFFIKNIYPRVQYMILLTEIAFKQKQWTNISNFEPYYA